MVGYSWKNRHSSDKRPAKQRGPVDRKPNEGPGTNAGVGWSTDGPPGDGPNYDPMDEEWGEGLMSTATDKNLVEVLAEIYAEYDQEQAAHHDALVRLYERISYQMAVIEKAGLNYLRSSDAAFPIQTHTFGPPAPTPVPTFYRVVE